jgi:predicted ATPase
MPWRLPGRSCPSGQGDRKVFIERIRIANFKSLKDVELRPEGLATLVGPNNAGKTNFVTAMEFLSDVHEDGLEKAISHAGGFESIARRTAHGQSSRIRFEVDLGLGKEQSSRRGTWPHSQWTLLGLPAWVSGFTLSHAFSIKAGRNGYGSRFSVEEETFQVSVRGTAEGRAGASRAAGAPDYTCSLTRDSSGNVDVRATGADWGPPRRASGKFSPLCGRLRYLARLQRLAEWSLKLGQQELLVSSAQLNGLDAIGEFSKAMRQTRVLRLSPLHLGQPAVATPNPEIGIHGEDLPAVVEWLRRKQPKAWRQVLTEMSDIVPNLKDISTEVLPSKRLALYIHEEGIPRAWGADEVSDGTIQTLGMLAVTFDPRVSAVVIDEPENSLHPWMIHELGRRLRRLAKQKTVIVTTQSPVVIDLLYPSELWVVFRRKGATNIRRLTELDRRIEAEWAQGHGRLSSDLDMGLVRAAVPGGGDG